MSETAVTFTDETFPIASKSMGNFSHVNVVTTMTKLLQQVLQLSFMLQIVLFRC